MIPPSTLTLCGRQHSELQAHLFPGDGKEAAAILICAKVPGPRSRLVVRHINLVPHAACPERAADYIVWPGLLIEDAIDVAEPESLVVILIHSHPGGWLQFSPLDDRSDRHVLPSLFNAFGDTHGTAIMTPDGRMRARLYSPDLTVSSVDLISVIGDDISFFWDHNPSAKRPMAFTSDMTTELSRISAAVVGVSGTGSIVAEALARLGIGRITLIDFDKVEYKNLNRILNSTEADAQSSRLKVEMFAASISRYRPSDVAIPIPVSVNTREAVIAAAQCDVLFSCVDKLQPRYIVDLIGSSFLIPIFDVGVVIPVRKAGSGIAIADVYGRIDYVQPGGSTLEDRGVYDPDRLRQEYLHEANPEAYARELEEGYIRGASEQAPSVITLNMRAASACVNEFIARAFPFRHDPNRRYARTEFSLAAGEEDYFAEDTFASSPSDLLGRGGLEPLLGLPALKQPRKV